MQQTQIAWDDTWTTRFKATPPEEQARMQAQENDFRGFYETHRAELEARAMAALYNLSQTIGWFSPSDIADEPFYYQETTVYDAERKQFEIGYTLCGKTDRWLDVYGWWSASFQGTFLVGVWREQH